MFLPHNIVEIKLCSYPKRVRFIFEKMFLTNECCFHMLKAYDLFANSIKSNQIKKITIVIVYSVTHKYLTKFYFIQHFNYDFLVFNLRLCYNICIL